jgi:hypothetical protein
MTEKQFLDIPNCGRKTLNEMKDVLSEHNLSFTKTSDGFKRGPFEFSKLKVKYTLNGNDFLVRYIGNDFVVIEYRSGGVYKLPIKELGPFIRIEYRGKILARRVWIRELVQDSIIKVSRFQKQEVR